MPLQEGIYHATGATPGKFFGVAFLRAAEDMTAADCAGRLDELWAMWQDLRAGTVRDLRGTTVPGGDLTALLGMGPKAFALKGARAMPEGLAAACCFQQPIGSGGGPLVGMANRLSYADEVRSNPANEPFAVQFIANSKLAVDRAIVETWKLLDDRRNDDTGTAELTLTAFYLGFQRDDHRSWIDFHDGISNLRSQDRERTISLARDEVLDEDAWLVGGTTLAFLRLEVDLPTWRAIPPETQEFMVGRDKLSGCPLTTLNDGIGPLPGCPVGGAQIWETANDGIAEPPSDARNDEKLKLSHVQRANQHRRGTDRSSLRIFRQGYEFMEWKESAPGFRLGLNFVSFQDTSERLIKVLSLDGWLGDVNFGGDPNDQPPGMERLLRVYASGVFVVPPLRESTRFPGADAYLAPAEA